LYLLCSFVLQVWGDRIFVTFPKWKPGIPATLGYVTKNGGRDQIVKVYPNWKWHDEGNCNGLTSVFRIAVSIDHLSTERVSKICQTSHEIVVSSFIEFPKLRNLLVSPKTGGTKNPFTYPKELEFGLISTVKFDRLIPVADYGS
jgi:carotenoid cleavage dioxygenase-like enzyme